MISRINLGALLLCVLLHPSATAAEEFCASADGTCAANPTRGNRRLDESADPTCASSADAETRCSRWAVEGECESNPNYMLAECAKSCCEKKHAVPSCDPYEDADDACLERALSGECQSNSKYMMRNCLRSCCRAGSPNGSRSSPAPFVGDPTIQGDACASYVDEDATCGAKGAAGECRTNPEFMNRRCAGTCCRASLNGELANGEHDCEAYRDLSGDCMNRATAGECQSNPDAMMSGCTRSCCEVAGNPSMSSQGAQGCDAHEDEGDDCQSDASAGKCDADPHAMLERCQRSCCLETGIDLGIKQVLGAEPAEHRRSLQKLVDSYLYLRHEVPGVECANKNEFCAFWAGIGECTSKQTQVFMEGSCALACKKCQ